MRPRGFKVKTIKLRGEISQGLILPLNIIGDNINETNFEIGEDLTELIGVTKYENDADFTSSSNINAGTSSFPDLVVEKTDEQRIQSKPDILENFMGKPFYSTLKYDGSSATYFIDPNNPDDFFICSRNFRRDYDPTDLFSRVADQYKIKEKLLANECRYVVQGEIYGPKISKNYLQMKITSFVVFNIKDLKDGRFLDFDELKETCKKLDLPMVEIIEVGECFNYTVEELKKISKGNYPGTKNPREGLVFRLQKDWNTVKRFSFKIINDDFLIKHEGK